MPVILRRAVFSAKADDEDEIDRIFNESSIIIISLFGRSLIKERFLCCRIISV